MRRGVLELVRSALVSALSVPDPPTCGFRLLRTFPHDSGAFTQGLCFDAASGTLLESTGLYGESTVRRVDLGSGRVLQSEDLPRNWFGEGLTLHDGRCVQLLWREGKGVVRDPTTFEVRDTFKLPRGCREGWGLTHDGAGALYLSDGSDRLFVLDGENFNLRHTVDVRAGGRPLRRLNELQWIRGEIWANVWGADHLAVIDPQSGAVSRFVDLRTLLTPSQRSQLGDEEYCLNGIAHDPVNDRLFVTGKCWPYLYEIAVERAQLDSS